MRSQGLRFWGASGPGWGLRVCFGFFAPKAVLGGSWVVASRVLSAPPTQGYVVTFRLACRRVYTRDPKREGVT